MFYQVRKALYMIKGYYQMPYIDITSVVSSVSSA
jgi:hypothetical protein